MCLGVAFCTLSTSYLFIFKMRLLRLCEGHCLFHVGRYANRNGLVVTRSALLLYRLAAQQMTLAGAAAQDFAAGCHFEAFYD